MGLLFPAEQSEGDEMCQAVVVDFLVDLAQSGPKLGQGLQEAAQQLVSQNGARENSHLRRLLDALGL